MKIVEYNVMGSGQFPLDMLRYDRAWPAREDQIHMICPRSRGASGSPAERTDPLRGERVIKVQGLREPTMGRWASFGWHVADVRRFTA